MAPDRPERLGARRWRHAGTGRSARAARWRGGSQCGVWVPGTRVGAAAQTLGGAARRRRLMTLGRVR